MIYGILFFAVLPAQYYLGWIGMMAAVLILSAGKKIRPWPGAVWAAAATLPITAIRDFENHFIPSERLSAMFGLGGHYPVYLLMFLLAAISAFLTIKAATTLPRLRGFTK